MGPPPPVNRGEKPRVPNKPILTPSSIDEPVPVHPTATPLTLSSGASPFSTPPSSGSSSSPDPESTHSYTTRQNVSTTEPSSRAQTPKMSFEPPPTHHTVANRRREHETGPQGRNFIFPQVADDPKEHRPVLPARPSVNMSSSLRTSIDVPRSTRATGPAVDMSKPYPQVGTTVELPIPPPKRNFSTPTSHVHTPPRPHGRSMTVDHASDRAPAEFRTIKSTMTLPDKFQSSAVLQHSAATVESTAFSQTEYPDNSHTNRRPPQLKRCPSEISTKSDTRIFDVFGEYVCTSGYTTRIWSLLDGEQVINIPHGDTIKILSLAFKPAASPGDEGSALWLGNNIGEIIEVEIASQTPIVASNSTAHSRREVARIYRHANEMWTLDDSGTLHVWGPDNKGTPNLKGPSATHRVPKFATFSMVVGKELWHATGTEIRIFSPSLEGDKPFQVLQRPLSQPGAGEVTSGAIISSQPDHVYLGHSDGKVSIYSRHKYVCLATANVSMYKINALAGVGEYLWAAYNTGTIYIYDTSQTPWVVKKDWRAHGNPVINIMADSSSLWKLDRLQVVSLGADNFLRTWDGLLQDDWLGTSLCWLIHNYRAFTDFYSETEMQNQDEKFCDFEQIKTLVMTWNAGASTPSSLRYAPQDAAFFPNLLKESRQPDILVFGFQELVDLEDKKKTASESILFVEALDKTLIVSQKAIFQRRRKTPQSLST
jgi:hypothetical protein